MKSKLVIITLLASLPFISNAQLGGVFNKVKSKVNQRVDSKIDKAIDETLDKAEEKETVSSQPASNDKKQETNEDGPAVTIFTKYDFVAGEQIVYYDNFEQETIAELPTGWNTNGTGEVVDQFV